MSDETITQTHLRWIAKIEKELAEARDELRAYRVGGLTEEILRRNDGCIKVGRGISFVLTSDLDALKHVNTPCPPPPPCAAPP